MMKDISIALALTALCFSLATAQPGPAPTSMLAIELDPMPFLLQGYSFSLKYGPERLPRLALMASVYSSRFPDQMMAKENSDNGFRDMRFETSYAAFMEYYPSGRRQGFYFGPSVFFYHKSVGHDDSSARATFRSLYPNARAGYVWYPFKKAGLYLNPWLNLGSEIKLGDGNQLEGREFVLNKFHYIASVHIGYRVALR